MIAGHNFRRSLEQRSRELDGMIADAWDRRDRAAESLEYAEMEMAGSCQPARLMGQRTAREALRRRQRDYARLRDERSEVQFDLGEAGTDRDEDYGLCV